jgi:hypothetical protein
MNILRLLPRKKYAKPHNLFTKIIINRFSSLNYELLRKRQTVRNQKERQLILGHSIVPETGNLNIEIHKILEVRSEGKTPHGQRFQDLLPKNDYLQIHNIYAISLLHPAHRKHS